MQYIPICAIVSNRGKTYPKDYLPSIIYQILSTQMGRTRAAKEYAKHYKIHTNPPLMRDPQKTTIVYPPSVDVDRELVKAYTKLTEILTKRDYYIELANIHFFNPLCTEFAALLSPQTIYVADGYLIAHSVPSRGTLPVKFFYGENTPKNTGEYYEDDIEIASPTDENPTKFRTLIVKRLRKNYYGRRMYNIPYRSIAHLEKVLYRIEYGPVAVTLYDGKHTTKDALRAAAAVHILSPDRQVPVLFINDYSGKTIDVEKIREKYPNTIIRVNGEVITPFDVPHAGRGLPYEKLYKDPPTENR